MGNQQINKKFSDEQVIAILENHLAKEISAKEAMAKLELKRSQFFNLAAKYRDGSDNFTIKHKGNAGNRKISEDTSSLILKELKKEKKLIDNKDLPIKFYNYSAVKDALGKVSVSLPTIINLAKIHGYYLKKPGRKIHDREALTNLIGELLQHDSSHHLWSPYMKEKLYLITTIDDYSRLLLYAELIEEENVWAHIMALKSVFLQYGCPFKYYPDQHSIFRYIKDRDKNRPHNTFRQFTDAIDPQWKQVLKDLVYQYNCRWVHSTTKEIPIVKFENAIRNRQSLFKPLRIAKQNQTIDDIFCLRAERVVDSYRKISLNNVELRVPGGIPRQTVDLRLAPGMATGLGK